MINGLDIVTQSLYEEIVKHAERIRQANPTLYGDIASTTIFDTFGCGLKGSELCDKFNYLFEKLLKTDPAFLIVMRDEAWELRKKQKNTNTHDGKESSPYNFIDAIIRYKQAHSRESETSPTN